MRLELNALQAAYVEVEWLIIWIPVVRSSYTCHIWQHPRYDKKTRLAPGAVSAMNSRRFARLPREREMAIASNRMCLMFMRPKIIREGRFRFAALFRIPTVQKTPAPRGLTLRSSKTPVLRVRRPRVQPVSTQRKRETLAFGSTEGSSVW